MGWNEENELYNMEQNAQNYYDYELEEKRREVERQRNFEEQQRREAEAYERMRREEEEYYRQQSNENNSYRPIYNNYSSTSNHSSSSSYDDDFEYRDHLGTFIVFCIVLVPINLLFGRYVLLFMFKAISETFKFMGNFIDGIFLSIFCFVNCSFYILPIFLSLWFFSFLISRDRDSKILSAIRKFLFFVLIIVLLYIISLSIILGINVIFGKLGDVFSALLLPLKIFGADIVFPSKVLTLEFFHENIIFDSKIYIMFCFMINCILYIFIIFWCRFVFITTFFVAFFIVYLNVFFPNFTGWIYSFFPWS